MNIELIWEYHYTEVLHYMREQKRLPSKHRPEEHQMLNWLKVNKRRFRRGQMPASRVERFKRLLAVAEEFKRVNQYSYISGDAGPTLFTL